VRIRSDSCCLRPPGPAESAIITELFYDRGHHQEFLSLSQEVAAPGDLRQAQTFDFLFKNVEKQYESYLGINVKLRLAALNVFGSRIFFLTYPR
jgi:hypothetical protein